NTLIQWDETYDSLIYDQGFLRMIGWSDISAPPDNPPVITSNNREHLWTLRFSIDSLAIPQTVTIDTTYDPVNGSLLFGLTGGVHVLIPVFTPGVIFYGTTSEVSDMTQPLPQRLTLYQNFPNPFNSYTVIRYYLPDDGHVSIEIYDLLGRRVRNLVDAEETAGTHGVTLKANGLSSGIYFYTLKSEGKTETIRMQLLK
ncbi:MAG: T9SS type A sorting domain-containing protein, partial [Candidatus Zixiibacteriota bacterium]